MDEDYLLKSIVFLTPPPLPLLGHPHHGRHHRRHHRPRPPPYTPRTQRYTQASSRKERLEWNKDRALLKRKVAEAEARASEAADGVASPEEVSAFFVDYFYAS